jgi:hypothetical protein
MKTDEIKKMGLAYLSVLEAKTNETEKATRAEWSGYNPFADVHEASKKEDASNDKSDDGEGLDKVDPKAAKKKFKDRKDKDVDNDGDTDSSDEYLHKKRKAVGKAMAAEKAKKEEAEDEEEDEEEADKELKASKKKKVKESSNPFAMRLRKIREARAKIAAEDDDEDEGEEGDDEKEIMANKKKLKAGNKFTGALQAAKKAGDKTFVVSGKKYVVKEAKLDKADYDANVQVKTGGYLPKVLNKETGKAVYVGSVYFKDEKSAKGHAQAYLDGYVEAGGNERRASKATAAYDKSNASKIKESNDDANSDDEIMAGKKKALKAKAAVEKGMKDKEVKEDFDTLVDMSDADFDKLLEEASDEQLEGIIGAIGKGLVKGVKKVANRLSTSGRADAADNKLKKATKKVADKARIQKAKAGLAALKKKPVRTNEEDEEDAGPAKDKDQVCEECGQVHEGDCDPDDVEAFKSKEEAINAPILKRTPGPKKKKLKADDEDPSDEDSVEKDDEVEEGYSEKEVKMAIGIASDPRYKGGNMTGASKAIEKIKKGLSSDKQVAAVLRKQNEDLEEAKKEKLDKTNKASMYIKDAGIEKEEHKDIKKDVAKTGAKVKFPGGGATGDIIYIGSDAQIDACLKQHHPDDKDLSNLMYHKSGQHDKDYGSQGGHTYKAEGYNVAQEEVTIEKAYAGVQNGMRQAMMRMWEDAQHTKGATKPEGMFDKNSGSADKMVADHKPVVAGDAQKVADEAAKIIAGSGKVSPKNNQAASGDNKMKTVDAPGSGSINK